MIVHTENLIYTSSSLPCTHTHTTTHTHRTVCPLQRAISSGTKFTTIKSHLFGGISSYSNYFFQTREKQYVYSRGQEFKFKYHECEHHGNTGFLNNRFLFFFRGRRLVQQKSLMKKKSVHRF